MFSERIFRRSLLRQPPAKPLSLRLIISLSKKSTEIFLAEYFLVGIFLRPFSKKQSNHFDTNIRILPDRLLFITLSNLFIFISKQSLLNRFVHFNRVFNRCEYFNQYYLLVLPLFYNIYSGFEIQILILNGNGTKRKFHIFSNN